MKSLKNKLPELSLFYPAFNEAGNIEEAVKQALFVLPKIAEKYEIIVVNDGSTDATKQIAKRLSVQYKNVRLVSQKNKGYGGALKRGFKEAKYGWIFFTDADLQFDLKELASFIAYTDDHDMVLGYRLVRAEGLRRDLIAKCLKLWSFVILGFPSQIKDIDCAFKLIKKAAIQSTYPLQSNGAMVSTELLLKLLRKDYSYQQIGVKHYKRSMGVATGNNLKVIVKAISDTVDLKIYFAKESLANLLSFAIVKSN